MNLTSPNEVRAILDRIGVRPCSALGQNFLIDRNIRDILLAAADLHRRDGVLEIGPGLGVLTEELAARAGRVVAIEKDRRLHEFLQRELAADCPRLELRCADFLSEDARGLVESGLNKVVSDLPYAAGSRMLVDLVQLPEPPERLVVTVQREVAERIIAPSGGSDYGLMSIWIQMRYEVRIERVVSPSCFWPRPEVESAIVSMKRTADRLERAEDRAALYAVTRLAFGHRRKQLQAILGKAPSEWRVAPDGTRALLLRMGLDGRARPEALSVDQWVEFIRTAFGGQRREFSLDCPPPSASMPPFS
jgi:16S rRNA (adenine1518-N6/adenine1519-N6)-dimethyltransferase